MCTCSGNSKMVATKWKTAKVGLDTRVGVGVLSKSPRYMSRVATLQAGTMQQYRISTGHPDPLKKKVSSHAVVTEATEIVNET